MTSASDIRRFWFGELRDGLADEAHRNRWFSPDADFDAEIREHFGPLLTTALEGGLSAWQEDPADALALVLLSDQFSRQVHRGSAAAFATDPLALATARHLVEEGADRTLALDERAFLYMPFEHSESRLDQHTSVGLFTALRDDTPSGRRQVTGQYLRYAQQHRDIVLRFGRFPHRNGVLDRPSTAEEAAFLETASDYGQSAPQR